MSDHGWKVRVIRLPEQTDLTEAMHAVQQAIGPAIEGSRVYAAILDDAEAVLRVFGPGEAH